MYSSSWKLCNFYEGLNLASISYSIGPTIEWRHPIVITVCLFVCHTFLCCTIIQVCFNRLPQTLNNAFSSSLVAFSSFSKSLLLVNDNCIFQDFKNLVLDEGTLEVAICFGDALLAQPRDDDYNRCHRNAAHRQFTIWTHGYLVAGSCCEPSGQYVGYVDGRFGW